MSNKVFIAKVRSFFEHALHVFMFFPCKALCDLKDVNVIKFEKSGNELLNNEMTFTRIAIHKVTNFLLYSWLLKGMLIDILYEFFLFFFVVATRYQAIAS